LIAALIGGALTWALGRRREAAQIGSLTENLRVSQEAREKLEASQADLQADLAKAKAELTELRKDAGKLKEVREKLARSTIVQPYHQPVVLVGPKDVGKTSLLLQWHAPWERYSVAPTQTHHAALVPVYDFDATDLMPHFADEGIRVPCKVHLKLKVHDCPGELAAQKHVRDIAVQETEALRGATNKDLGIVIVCMFDAEEAHIGVRRETVEYYNGDLFRTLREMVSFAQVHIDRLILVFNKYDLLRRHYEPRVDDRQLLELCLDKFENIYGVLRGTSSSEKMCEVFTAVPRQDMHLNNRGAPIVKGEAARRFVHMIAGPDAVLKVAPKAATTYVQARFVE
jgi:hypothetical protein